MQVHGLYVQFLKISSKQGKGETDVTHICFGNTYLYTTLARIYVLLGVGKIVRTMMQGLLSSSSFVSSHRAK